VTTTYTANIKLGKPAHADTGWDVPVNANADQLDAIAAIGGLAVTPAEVPSASLDVTITAGVYVKQDGTLATYAGVGSFALAASGTKVLYLDLTAGGALTAATAFPTTAHVRLASVVAGSSTITSITDARVAYRVCGTTADGVNLAFGTTTGTQIGTASTQKLGFFGATPVVRPSVPAATAGTSYTTNEQSMLQAVYNAIHSLGLGG
jgi:hypothetical protein